MAQELHDPNLPAGEIVEKRKDGSALRNDGVELQPANKNPWYVLATIAGEQEEGFPPWRHDRDLAAKNRRYWNGWACRGIDLDKWPVLAEATGLNSSNFNPLTAAEKNDIKTRFEEIFGAEVEIPKPSDKVQLANTYFPMPLILEKYVIISPSYFKYSYFEGLADFRATYFKSEAYFTSALFETDASFSSTQFQSFVDFSSVCFKSRAIFISTNFKGRVNFSSVNFKRIANFKSTYFVNHAHFNLAQFERAANFNSANFLSTTYFSTAKFIATVPTFYAAQLFEETKFPASDKMLDHWPSVTDERAMSAEDQKPAYNRLRLFMSQNLKIDEEMFFHRREMACKAEIETGLVRWMFKAYGAVSDYGSSVVKPLLWLGYIWVIGILGMFGNLPNKTLASSCDILPTAMAWSFSNIFAFFGFRSMYFDAEFNKGLVPFLDVIAASQTVFGFIFLFLLGLGLRNRFRLRKTPLR